MPGALTIGVDLWTPGHAAQPGAPGCRVRCSPQDALTRLGGRTALSHESAARVHGIELLRDTGVDRVTVPRERGRARLDGWLISRADVECADRSDGLAVTTPARTVADLARVLTLHQAVAAADSAVRRGIVTVPALIDALAGARGPGAGRLRAVASLVDGRSGSVVESAARVELHLAGLPPPELQYEVRDEWGRVVARVDLAWPARRWIVEVDGFAFHSDRLAYRRDREKMNELERLGWRILRVTWEDVVLRPAAFVELVRECLVGT